MIFHIVFIFIIRLQYLSLQCLQLVSNYMGYSFAVFPIMNVYYMVVTIWTILLSFQFLHQASSDPLKYPFLSFNIPLSHFVIGAYWSIKPWTLFPVFITSLKILWQWNSSFIFAFIIVATGNRSSTAIEYHDLTAHYHWFQRLIILPFNMNKYINNITFFRGYNRFIWRLNGLP